MVVAYPVAGRLDGVLGRLDLTLSHFGHVPGQLGVVPADVEVSVLHEGAALPELGGGARAGLGAPELLASRVEADVPLGVAHQPVLVVAVGKLLPESAVWLLLRLRSCLWAKC